MGKKLVAYFSASGITARVAKTLAEAASADLYEIQPETPYSKADLDWRDSGSRSTVEMQNPASRPAIAGEKADTEAYEVIFVGFPIWWYVAPTIINTFLESHDLFGKTIVPFATSGSSGFGKTVEALLPSVSATATWKEGKILNGQPTRQELAAWVESLQLL